MTVENEPCCKSAPRAANGDVAEAAALAKASDRARRDGPVLRLKLEGGRSLKITDCDDQGACEAERFRKHRLVAWWPKSGYYVVDVQLYETSEAYLISATNGLTTRIAAPPVPSPSSKYAIAYNPGMQNGPRLDLLEMRAERPVVRDIYPATCPGRSGFPLVGSPRWVSDTEVVFDRATFPETNSRVFKMTLRIAADSSLTWKCDL